MAKSWSGPAIGLLKGAFCLTSLRLLQAPRGNDEGVITYAENTLGIDFQENQEYTRHVRPPRVAGEYAKDGARIQPS